MVDSVAALTPKAELEGNMGDSHVGLQVRIFRFPEFFVSFFFTNSYKMISHYPNFLRSNLEKNYVDGGVEPLTFKRIPINIDVDRVQARLMSQALRKLTPSLGKHNRTVLIFINQIRHKIGVMFGSPETTTGGAL